MSSSLVSYSHSEMDSGQVTPMALERRTDLGLHLHTPRELTPSVRDVVLRPVNRRMKLPVFQWSPLPTSVPQSRKRTQDPQVPPFLVDFMEELWEPRKAEVQRASLYQPPNNLRARIKRTVHTQRPPLQATPQSRAISVERRTYKPYTIEVSPKAKVVVYSRVPLRPTPVKGRVARHSSVERKPASRQSIELPALREDREMAPFPEFEEVAWTFGERVDRARLIAEHAKTQLDCV